MNAQPNSSDITLRNILDSEDPRIFELQTKSPGPQGRVPVTEDMLRNSPSGDLFAYSQNAGMGWSPDQLNGKQFLVINATAAFLPDSYNHARKPGALPRGYVVFALPEHK